MTPPVWLEVPRSSPATFLRLWLDMCLSCLGVSTGAPSPSPPGQVREETRAGKGDEVTIGGGGNCKCYKMEGKEGKGREGELEERRKEGRERHSVHLV